MPGPLVNVALCGLRDVPSPKVSCEHIESHQRCISCSKYKVGIEALYKVWNFENGSDLRTP